MTHLCLILSIFALCGFCWVSSLDLLNPEARRLQENSALCLHSLSLITCFHFAAHRLPMLTTGVEIGPGEPKPSWSFTILRLPYNWVLLPYWLEFECFLCVTLYFLVVIYEGWTWIRSLVRLRDVWKRNHWKIPSRDVESEWIVQTEISRQNDKKD